MFTLNKHKRHFLRLLSYCLFIMVAITSCTTNVKWPDTRSTHSPSVEALWVRSNMYSKTNSQPLLAFSNEKIIFLGSDDQLEREKIVALDALTGNIVWQIDNPNGLSLVASNSAIFVGGIGEVFAFDSRNGDKLWSTQLPLSRSVANMYLAENSLTVDTVSSRYFILDVETGEILQRVDYDAEENIPLWRQFSYGASWQAPVLQKDIIYGRTGERYGRAFAVRGSSENILWRTEDNIISNVSTTMADAYVLSMDGKLISIALKDGGQKIILEFDAVPFQLTSEATGGYRYPYYVLVSEQKIYVFLGDSAQLFAFQTPN